MVQHHSYFQTAQKTSVYASSFYTQFENSNDIRLAYEQTTLSYPLRVKCSPSFCIICQLLFGFKVLYVVMHLPTN